MKPYYADEWVTIYLGDCREILPELPKVDLVLTDPPYGTTACPWDTVIPFDIMWRNLLPLRKPRTPIVIFGSEPFSSLLRVSNIGEFKYDWVWQKNRGSNFASTKYQPMKEHETISVFYTHNYYPIMQERTGGGISRVNYGFNPSNTGRREYLNGLKEEDSSTRTSLRCPSSIQKFNTEVGLHPTQKPLTLMEYLAKTYSQAGDLVLDFAMGSGTTLLACVKLNRKCIGIEIKERYCEIAAKRCSQGVFNLSGI